ncbi:MAG: PilZ domain-containing protein [Candidatus Angelobacter sp.]
MADTGARILESHGFQVFEPMRAAEARNMCAERRFDLAVYDEDSPGATGMARNEPRSAPHVILRLVSPDSGAQSLSGRSHFLLQKPFTSDLFAKTIRACYGAIALGRRSSFRHEVSVAASACRIAHEGETRRLDRVTMINISATGMCVETADMLPQGAQISLSFRAKEVDATLYLQGTVVWAHASGRAGIKLVKTDSEKEGQFEAWLASMLPAANDFLPAVVPSGAGRPLPRLPVTSIYSQAIGKTLSNQIQ